MPILRNLKAIDSLRIASFRTYFFSRLCDAAAMNIRQMSLGFLMYRLTGSATLLGILVVARAVPLLVVSPIAGAIADRVQKKYIIQISGLVDMALALGIAFGLTSGYLSSNNPGSWWVLIVASLLDGIVTSFKGPTSDAMVVEVVGENLITNAVALNQVGQNTLRLAAPVIAGILIDAYDFYVVYFLMAAIYFAAVVLMSFIPPTSKPFRSETHILGDIKDVWQYIKQERDILFVLISVFCIVLLSMPYRQLLPIFTEDILKVGGTGLGLLQGVSAGGAILGGIIMAFLPNNKRRGIMMIFSAFVLGISLVFFSFSKSWYFSLGLMVLVGIGQAGRMTLPVAMLQYYTKSEYRARVMSFYGIEFGLSSFGTFFAAILAANIGVEWSVGGLALGLAVLSILALVFVQRLRRLD
jgi:MFS family permease